MAVDRTGWYGALVDDDSSGLTGTIWNKAQVNGLLTEVDKTQVACQVATAGASIPQLTETLVHWEIDDHDNYNMHDVTAASNWAITFPYAGIYVLQAAILWQHNASGVRGLAFKANDASLITPWHYIKGEDTGFVQSQSLFTTVYLPANNWVSLVCYHSAPGPIFLGNGCRMSVFRIS